MWIVLLLLKLQANQQIIKSSKIDKENALWPPSDSLKITRGQWLKENYSLDHQKILWIKTTRNIHPNPMHHNLGSYVF